MYIITHSCSLCGTIVAANVLEENRVMKCPGIQCNEILRFNDLPDEEQTYYLNNKSDYEM